MKLPCYPLVTIDPMMSIWSKSEKLYESDTILWCGIRKAMRGTVVIDGERYRFMGLSKEPEIGQKSVEVTPLVTVYRFENKKIALTVKFWTPLFWDDLIMLSTPCSFIECEFSSADGKVHNVSAEISLDKEFCYDRIPKPVKKQVKSYGKIKYAVMGRKKQKPVSKSGDGVSADWGYICLYGDEVAVSKNSRAFISARSDFKNGRALFIFAYDDIKSVEYMGEKLDGYYKQRFSGIGEAIEYCAENYGVLYEGAVSRNKTIRDDAEIFSRNYADMVTAACRQVLAGHKPVRDAEGNILYFSKECHSNGCINTVDVSYPALPFFLIYNPELIKGMMTGIFAFARTNAWQYDFAPHDIGTYPIANGQVYGCFKKYSSRKGKAGIYKQNKNVFRYDSQMPVEECGNMLIMAYAHYVYSKDKSVIEKNFDLLEGWAKYLVNASIELENQLCTDDFAGHSEKNVNLAIKEIMGIAAFSKICGVLGVENSYFETAAQYAAQLSSFVLPDGTLPFALDEKNTWSLKYNLVWDKLFSFNLFSEELYRAESSKYKQKLDTYGVPLDYRKKFTKTDWMMWAAALDENNDSVNLYSKAILKYLADTGDDICFSDWIDTDVPKSEGFNHRTVQGGLWMPVLFSKTE